MNTEDSIHIPGWRPILHALGVFGGLLLLAGLVMALILFVANFFDENGKKQAMPIFIDIATSSAAETNARTRYSLPNSFVELPSHPGRSIPVNLRGGNNERSRGGGGSGNEGRASMTASPQVAQASPPVGLTADEYRATIESGKKIHLPNPQGECDLRGQSTAKLISALDNCFALRAAR
jgi:hypothetical protein